jgi:hypothetical protein
MKKIFTLICALVGFAGVASAETIDDVEVCKHSYVLVFDDWDNNGAGKPGKGKLFGNGYFLDVTGGSVATNKQSVDLSDETFAGGAYIKYAAYGKHLNSWRLKNGQDVIAMKVTAGSKIIILGQAHSSRGPQINDTAPANNNMQGKELASSANTAETGGVFEWTADDNRTIYIGSKGGDYFVSYLIVEANETAGTPEVKVGDQTFENGLYFKEVTCTPQMAERGGKEVATVVTYTTDGSTPDATSPVYKEPIKCFADATIKFQAFMDLRGTGVPQSSALIQNAENEAKVNFSFEAPSISANGAEVTIASIYENATNYYTQQVSLAANATDAVAGNNLTLTESATIVAYTEIKNGSYATFTSKTAAKDVYILNPIKEKKTIAVTGGDKVLDEEATKTSTTGDVYVVENGTISADKVDFFVKGLTFAVLNQNDYKIDDQDIYIKMSDTNISFMIAASDSVNVKVICSKNSCKNINADDNTDGSAVNDRKCFVNVSGKNYGGEDLVLNPNGNVIEFGLAGGTEAAPEDKIYTFQKYSGTGNILISSIEITPVEGGIATGISNIAAEKASNSAIYNLAGQKVSNDFKGLVIKNGKKFVVK